MEGISSNKVDALYGVPQMLILGTSLVLYYVINLPTNLESKICLFAYLTIADTKDAKFTQ